VSDGYPHHATKTQAKALRGAMADRDAQQQRLMEEQANRYKAKLEELAVRHQRKMAEAHEKMAAEAADRGAAADETHAGMMAEFDNKMSNLASKLQAMAGREAKLVQRLHDVTAEMGKARYVGSSSSQVPLARLRRSYPVCRCCRRPSHLRLRLPA